MRIVIWNCGMRLRGEKLQALEDLRPDIAIIPTCEGPNKLWGKQPLLAPIPMEWIGDKKTDGLGVLAFNGYRLQRHADFDPSLRWLLPVEVRGPIDFRLLAVADASLQPGSLKYYQNFLKAGPAIVAGNFGQASARDGAKPENHARTIAALERLGMASASHVGRGELHGKETSATRCVAGEDQVERVQPARRLLLSAHRLVLASAGSGGSGSFARWVGKGFGDHVPLIVDLDLQIHARGPAAALEKDYTDRFVRRPAICSPFAKSSNLPAPSRRRTRSGIFISLNLLFEIGRSDMNRLKPELQTHRRLFRRR